jgi:fatty-acyl-CoA synthase
MGEGIRLELHYATLWEAIADSIGDREAVATGSVRRTWTEYEDRAARLARVFHEAGLGPDSKIGLYLWNGNEYLESQFAGMKIRGVPININYRYLDDELLYLLENSDAEALVFHRSLGDRVARVKDRAKGVKLWIEVDDGGEAVPGALDYEKLIASSDPAPRIKRSPSDLYMLYTGGTTGMPKGVMYEMGGMLQGFIGIGFPLLGLGVPPVESIPGLVTRLWEEQGGICSIPACPLMHGTGMWLGAMIPHIAGARVVLLEERRFDPDELWRKTEAEKATQLVIVGDAFARPMLRSLEQAKAHGRPFDPSSVRFMISSGVMWTREIKQALLDWHEFVLIDAMGSSEGSMGNQITTRGNVGETARFTMGPATKVFTEDGREVKPGSDEIGMVAAGGLVPVGYYKDPEKSAVTFREIDGVRYSFPGDWARVEADGTLTLLGRGSHCINTAGEKVYPEEVEEVVKSHPDVQDCLVVGVEDERLGQRVTAVASLVEDATVDAETLREFTRSKLAGYKVPKQIHLVDQVQRAANGKADYKWARREIESRTASGA